MAFLFVAPVAYPRIVTWSDVRSQELAPFRIPQVECWFPNNLPLSHIDEILVVEIVRKPSALEDLLAKSRQLE